MAVLVTGATGHLGATLVRALLARGRAVRVLVRRADPALEGLAGEAVRGDVRDRASLDAAVKGVEAVYHLAGLISLVASDEAALMAVNVEGTRNVAQACRAAGVRRMVHFSSVHALKVAHGEERTDEDRPLNLDLRAAPYDRSKALGERAVLDAVDQGLDAVILNPTAVLGPYGYSPRNQLRFLLDVYHGQLPALVEGGFDWVDTRDVAAAAIAAETLGSAGERYLLSGHWRSAREVSLEIAAQTGRKTLSWALPLWVARLGIPFAALWARLTGTPPLYTRLSLDALTEHRHCVSTKAARTLGFSARPFGQTIADTFSFWRELGLLRPEARDPRHRRALPGVTLSAEYDGAPLPR